MAVKMWWPSGVILLYASLNAFKYSAALGSRDQVFIRPNGCDKLSGSGEMNPDDSFPVDDNGSYYYVTSHENCTEDLTAALLTVTSHAIIILETGQYSINQFILVQNVANITLKAELKVVSIQCTENAGFAFVNVSQLSVYNIVFDGCGFTGANIENAVSLVKNIVNVFYAIPEVVKIALLFGHCEDVMMENVTIMNTRGFGLVDINVIGSSQLNAVLFFNNSYPGTCISPYILELFPSKSIDFDSRNRLGGAAAFMYFDFHDQLLYRGSQFSLTIRNCNFTFNAECSVNYLNILRRPGRGESSFVI